MTAIKDWLASKKTYILGGLLFVHGVVSWLAGDLPFKEMIQGSEPLLEMFSGGLIGTLRAAMQKWE